MIKMFYKTHCLLLLSALMIVMPHTASFAQEGFVDLPYVIEAEDNTLVPAESVTHTTIKLTPDKSELVRLEQEAGSIIIGNPLHVNVVADSSKTLVVVPRIPGATHFTVLDKKGQVLMQRHVIVASPAEDYIRIKRTCTEDAGDGCQQTSVFYCPDMCHEIGILAEGQETSGQDETASGEQSGGSNGNGGNGGDTTDE